MDVVTWLHENEHFFSREMNGYTGVPVGPYLSTLPLINQGGKVLDVGCGNGMLLKMIHLFSGHTLTPYGVDINSRPIAQAKERVLPEFKGNFHVEDLNFYDFAQGPFNIIIMGNPRYCNNLETMTRRYLGHLVPQGRLIFRIHDDVLRGLNLKSPQDIIDLIGHGAMVSRGAGLAFATIEKTT